MQELKDIIAKELGITAETLTSDFKLFDTGGMDSLDTFEVMMEIEDTFDIHIPDSTLQLVNTYGQLEEIVVKLIKEKQ